MIDYCEEEEHRWAQQRSIIADLERRRIKDGRRDDLIDFATGWLALAAVSAMICAIWWVGRMGR